MNRHPRARDARFVRALVLLCLVAHISLLTVTHHHSRSGLPNLQESSVAVSPGNGSGGPLGTGTDRCLSCCLQRNLVTDIRPISLPPDVHVEPVSRELLISEPGSNGVYLVLSDRAPPHI